MAPPYPISYSSEFPRRIICLTEESVEILYELGQEKRIVGVSSFVKRPQQAQLLPKVSLFTSSNISKILELSPDLVLGFSDLQKEIAKELIGHGISVFISNHRSLQEIVDYTFLIARLVGEQKRGESLCQKMLASVWGQSNELVLPRKPKIYFEEWDSPMISGIQWVSELIEAVGGRDIGKSFANGKLAKERIVNAAWVAENNPDIIFGCWCGKRVKIDSIMQRTEFSKIAAVLNHQVFELAPEIFLQPGPAPFLDGAEILRTYMRQWGAKAYHS